MIAPQDIAAFAHERKAAEDGSFRPLDRTIFGTGRSLAPSFPVELLKPFWAEWCKAHSAARKVPVDYVVAGLLAGAASSIGNARWASANPEWKEPPVLWLALVGKPGAGKSPALDPVLGIMRQIENAKIKEATPRVRERQEQIERSKTVRAAHLSALKESAKKGTASPPRPPEATPPEPLSLPRLLVADVTAEKLASILRDNPKGLLLHRDEMAGWIGSFGRYSGASGAERAMWLEAYGGRAFRVDRQSQTEPIDIDRLSVSVIGGLQPDRLSEITATGNDGFAPRFLFVWPEPEHGFDLSSPGVDSTAQRRAFQRLADLDLVMDEWAALSPDFLPLSADAAARLTTFGAEMKARALREPAPIDSVLSKATGTALRLGMVLEFLWWAEQGGKEPECISEPAIVVAIALLDNYFIPQAKRVFQEAVVASDVLAGRFVARHLKDRGIQRFNARGLRRALGGPVRKADEMTAACIYLEDAGVIRPVSRPSGGRPAVDFVVNPLFLEEEVQ